ncbi:hypothetical protein P154DRAFT_263693 [Amniculicola lignicola CBS 123094]|uniref:Uncharacterized protein n=1 Tax=Amniculicola lignicola CBS 123094 TaxID=1392246 RepID=A0A6A5W8C7_9PLEO|nr:hypothetical protein P154DRAFT_263693 [Amniculicola lignicola CBS 123094]
MRCFIALPALVAVVAAQAESFNFAATTTGNPATSAVDRIEPSATESTGPVDTARACAQISQAIDRSRLDFPSVEAELALACLQDVPINTEAASITINSIKQMVQFQSTLIYLKNPPEGYSNEPVDIIAGLDDIDKKVNNGEYKNEYDFENAIAELLVKAHDGHLGFDGMAYGGAFRWRRSRQASLISASVDGKELPKIWALDDYNSTGVSSYTPSAVTKINGEDAVQFLQKEALLNAYHDPDTRFNALFYMQPAESWGYFTNPRFYPGPSTSLTFENGTTFTYVNLAVVLQRDAWGGIEDGDTFYRTYIVPSTSSKIKKRSSPHSLPRQLQHPKEAELARRYVPFNYPKPAIEHQSFDVGLAGYFIDTSVGTIGVLMIQTFNTDDNNDAVEFQNVIQTYISEAKSRNVAKTVIDVRTNGGGKILLGYDAYLQFFPSQEPQLMSRYRGHQAIELIGEKISTLELTNQDAELYTSPFNYHAYLDKDLKPYDSWTDMYGPAKFNDDSFTNLLRYNLSDPLTTSSDRFSIGVTMTGYLERSNFTEDPFKAEDIIILSDGICASTCSLFTELMVQQSKVKTLAIGGRPETGPMQPVGGTKGSLVLQAEYLTALSVYIVQNFANSRSEARDWAEFLPNGFAINAADATVNFQDNIRKGLENDGMPTQFLNDSASCRVWYTPENYFNVTSVWEKVALVAFGKDGGMDEDACVSGSVTSPQQQQGEGDGNPTTSGTASSSSAKPTGTSGAAAGGARPQGSWTAALVCGVVVMASMTFGASLI